MLAGQAKHEDSPFEIMDHSIKEASADWKEKARTRIRRRQRVIVICGEPTDTATGINVEINIANDEGMHPEKHLPETRGDQQWPQC
jgi:ribosomal protein L36